MDRNYVVYTPTVEEIARIAFGEHYLEVWKGLPNLDFVAGKTRNGEKGLRYEQEGHYAWVVPNALRALDKDSETILVPMIKKTRDGKLYAVQVDLPPEIYGETLDSIVNKTKEMNVRHFFPAPKEKYEFFKIRGEDKNDGKIRSC
ncbi:MAG: hypothetical protein AABX04_02380 [Nanoarchaeota archaeon]